MVLETVSGFKAIIFDMDGTLVDNMRLHFESWYDLFWDLGVNLSLERVIEIVNGKTTDEILRDVLGSGLSAQKMDEFAERKEFHYRAIFRRHIKPLHGLRQFLRHARKSGLKLALATSAGPHNIEFTLSALKLKDYFPVIAGGKDVQHGKPEPDLFQLAASRLAMRAQECLVFEDSRVGLEAARRAGMRAVAVSTGFPMEELAELPNVIAVIRDYRELDGLFG
jgi:beta-phosphoglucomutase family hydrolase